MTVALCVKCGKFKHGAFGTCNECGFRPSDDYDMAYSLALTDRYFAWETLREIGRAIPEHGRPNLPAEQERQMLATVREPSLQRILGLGTARATDAKKDRGTPKSTTLMSWLSGLWSKT